MISARLVHIIEQHWEQITERVVRQLRTDADLYEIRKYPESELRERCRKILEHLGTQLTTPKDELIRKQEDFGKRRFEDNIPLHEAVHALQIIKQKTVGFVRDQVMGQTSLELYAEEELEYTLNRLFDEMIYRVVRGYERAMRAAQERTAIVEPATHAARGKH